MKKKIKNILGLTILEALMATAVVGIGFVAILSMVNYSVQSIDTSGERTKANYLVSMMAEDVIGHKNSIYGVNTNDKVVIGIDGTITIEGVEKPDARKFSDHLAGQDFFSRCGDNLALAGGDTAANAPATFLITFVPGKFQATKAHDGPTGSFITIWRVPGTRAGTIRP